MSFTSTLASWLFGTNNDATSASSASSIEPCRYLLDNSTSDEFILPDGRELGYAQYGSATGKAVLYNHGFPGSRIEASQHHDLCLGLGLRLIAIDRPGHGWSSPHRGAKLLDWPKDLEQLAEHLKLESYAVMGVSGGGPSALACAFALPPEKLKCVSIVCGVGPPDIGMRGADLPHLLGWPYGIRFAPYWFGRWFWRTQAIGRLDLNEEHRLKVLIKEGKNAPESDRDIYDDVDFLRLVVRSTGEAFAQGYDHVWDDGGVSCSDFGFKVQDIRKELPVQLWYGKHDYFVPLNHGLQIAARLGQGGHLEVKDEAHAGILIHWKKEIFEAIAKSM